MEILGSDNRCFTFFENTYSKRHYFNDCFGNYAISIGSYGCWPGAIYLRARGSELALKSVGWQYPHYPAEYYKNQIVLFQDMFIGAKQNISISSTDFRSPEESFVEYPNTYKGLYGIGGFFFSNMNDDLESFSQSDYLSFFNDFKKTRGIPLKISGTLRHLRWNYPEADDFRVFIVTLLNESEDRYDKFYFGIEPLIEIDAFDYKIYQNNIAYFNRETGTAYAFHPKRDDLGVAGITSFDTKSISYVNLEVDWMTDYSEDGYSFSDLKYWEMITSGEIQAESLHPHLCRIIMSLGPFSFGPGETLEFVFANVMGWNLESFHQHVANAWTAYLNDWYIPNPPPDAPLLIVKPGNREIRLIWTRNRNYMKRPLPAGFSGYFQDEDIVSYLGEGISDPTPFFEYSSESSIDPNSLERDWDGYRIYRNITGKGKIEDGDWALAIQLDSTYVHQKWGEIPEIDLDPETWEKTYLMEYTDRDPSIYNGFTYYYTVSAYDWGERGKIPPLPPAQSAASSNMQMATPMWIKASAPFEYQDKVQVVPNPYISGQYTTWENEKRKVDFIHLPGKCTIKVYTISGLLIRTLYHSDDISTQLSWNLTNHRGQELAPGVYIYRVIPEEGKEITGKFMIIR